MICVKIVGMITAHTIVQTATILMVYPPKSSALTAIAINVETVYSMGTNPHFFLNPETLNQVKSFFPVSIFQFFLGYPQKITETFIYYAVQYSNREPKGFSKKKRGR